MLLLRASEVCRGACGSGTAASCCCGWNDWPGSAFSQFPAQFGAVVSLVAKHMCRRLYPSSVRRRVVRFTSGQQNGDEAFSSICERVEPMGTSLPIVKPTQRAAEDIQVRLLGM